MLTYRLKRSFEELRGFYKILHEGGLDSVKVRHYLTKAFPQGEGDLAYNPASSRR
jgi:hypothetical protein